MYLDSTPEKSLIGCREKLLVKVGTNRTTLLLDVADHEDLSKDYFPCSVDKPNQA